MRAESSRNPVRVLRITSLAEFDQCARDWDEVILRTPNASVHARHFWLRRWLETAGQGREIAFRLMYDNDGVLGCAAWMRETKRVGPLSVPFLRLAGHPMSKRTQVVLARRQEESVKAMLADLREQRWLWLDPDRLHDSDPFLKVLASSSDVLGADERVSYVLPRVTTTTDWESYLASRSKKFRKQRKRGHLDGSLAVKNFPAGTPDIETLMSDIAAVARDSWAYQEGTSIVSSEQEWAFWQGVVADAAAQSTLRASCIYHQGRPVAFIFGMVEHGILYAVKTAFVSSAAQMGAGRAAFSAIIQAAMADPAVDMIDFDHITTHGDYKAAWATQLETVRSYYAFRQGVVSRALAAAYRFKRQRRQAAQDVPTQMDEVTA